METITEGKAKIKVETAKIVSKDMPVFYNPVMELNRTISVLLLNSIGKEKIQIGLPLEASGLRGIRFLKEISKEKIKSISFNDYDKKAVKSMKENLKLNKIKLPNKKISISCQDANIFLLNSSGFDYIDIDPFGTPNPFLDSAAKRIAREGILAVTATDTAPLSGTYPDACMRKYWAKPARNENMHEIGLRILIRKCQLIGAQFEKALIPIYSYSDEHYMRVFFLCEKGKEKTDKILKQHGMFLEAGPMWLGRLWDENLAEKMHSNFITEITIKPCKKEKEFLRFLRIIKDESKIDAVGFYNIPAFIKKNKLKKMPKQEQIISEIRRKGYNVSETHFRDNSLRSNIPASELLRLLKLL